MHGVRDYRRSGPAATLVGRRADLLSSDAAKRPGFEVSVARCATIELHNRPSVVSTSAIPAGDRRLVSAAGEEFEGGSELNVRIEIGAEEP